MKRYDKYKESGISWIGEIPEHWEEKKMRELIDFFSDKGYPNETLLSVVRERGVIIRDTESKEENHNYIPNDLSGYKRVKQGDFVINKMKAWQGSYAVSDYKGIVSPAYYTCKLRVPNKVFFSLAIRSKVYIPLFTQYSKGIRVDQWDLSSIGLKEIPFFLPPLSEQEAIVAYLEEKVAQMDNLVAKQEALIAYLRELKQAIIAKAVTRGINPEVPLRPSGIPWIGDIPEHWEVKRLKSLLCKTFSGEWGNEPTATNAYRCIRIADFDANLGSVFFRTEPTFRSYTRDDIQDKQVLNGDVLLEKSGGGEKTPVGRAVIWNTKDVNNPCMCANFIQVLRTKLEVLQPNFLMLLLSTIHAKDAVKLYIKQTIGIQNLTLKSYMIQPIPLPPSSEQEAIVTYINRKTEEIDRLIAMTEQEIARVRELKQTVIADVVTGRINVQPS